MTDNSNMGSGAATMSFIVGLGAGLAAGLLFAPRSGDDTRRQLKSKYDEMHERARNAMEKQKENIAEKVDKVQAKADRAVQEGRDMAEDITDKVTRRKEPGSFNSQQ